MILLQIRVSKILYLSLRLINTLANYAPIYQEFKGIELQVSNPVRDESLKLFLFIQVL